MRRIHICEVTEFFQFIHSIKGRITDWNLIEIKLSPEEAGSTVQDISEIIMNTFPNNEGKILICNAYEILGVMKPRIKQSTVDIFKKLEKAIPGHACFIEIETLRDGLAKIQLNLNVCKEAKKIQQAPPAEKKKLVLIAEPEEESRSLIGQVLGAHTHIADIIETGKADEALRLCMRHTPNLIFLNDELNRSVQPCIAENLLDRDPRAHIILIGNNSSATSILEAHQCGAKNYLLMPLGAGIIWDAIKACPDFGGDQKQSARPSTAMGPPQNSFALPAGIALKQRDHGKGAEYTTTPVQGSTQQH